MPVRSTRSFWRSSSFKKSTWACFSLLCIHNFSHILWLTNGCFPYTYSHTHIHIRRMQQEYKPAVQVTSMKDLVAYADNSKLPSEARKNKVSIDLASPMYSFVCLRYLLTVVTTIIAYHYTTLPSALYTDPCGRAC